MDSCPDCISAKCAVSGNSKYEIIDIGADVHALKEFLHLRDTDPAFAEAKRSGSVGIPCFVLEDGTVTLDPEVAGIKPANNEFETGASCSIDGKGC